MVIGCHEDAKNNGIKQTVCTGSTRIMSLNIKLWKHVIHFTNVRLCSVELGQAEIIVAESNRIGFPVAHGQNG